MEHKSTHLSIKKPEFLIKKYQLFKKDVLEKLDQFNIDEESFKAELNALEWVFVIDKELSDPLREQNVLEKKKYSHGFSPKLNTTYGPITSSSGFSDFSEEYLMEIKKSMQDKIKHFSSIPKFFKNFKNELMDTKWIIELMQKYNTQSLVEFEKLVYMASLDEEDLSTIELVFKSVKDSLERRLNEILCYRMATEFSIETQTDIFVKSVHSIFLDGLYRDFEIRSKIEGRYEKFETFPQNIVSEAMKQFSIFVEEKAKELQKEKNKQVLLKSSLASFLIFELIHPFSDGNGRSGRALFSFLQRKFSKGNILKPLHIPLNKTDKEADRLIVLGSIYHKVREKMQLVVFQHPKVIKIIKEIEEKSNKEIASESLNIKLRELYDLFITDEEVNNLLQTIETQSEKDDLQDTTWHSTNSILKEVFINK